MDAVLKGMTLREAEGKYNVKRETIRKHVKNIDTGRSAGGQIVLNSDEEACVVQHLMSMGMWGFPVTTLELRLIVKNYILRQGKVIKKFQDGCTPGIDWALAFMKRHLNKN